MSIENYFTKTISINRLTPVTGTDKETYAQVLTNIACRIESQGDEAVMLDDGAYYKIFKMFCGIKDIRIGDQALDEDGNYYWVKGVNKFDSQSSIEVGLGYHHLEITLALPQ